MVQDYPMKLFLFRPDGKYDPRETVTINNANDLESAKPIIISHINKGLEVRLTDPQDFCLFHAENGKIIFPKPQVK